MHGAPTLALRLDHGRLEGAIQLALRPCPAVVDGGPCKATWRRVAARSRCCSNKKRHQEVPPGAPLASLTAIGAHVTLPNEDR